MLVIGIRWERGTNKLELIMRKLIFFLDFIISMNLSRYANSSSPLLNPHTPSTHSLIPSIITGTVISSFWILRLTICATDACILQHFIPTAMRRCDHAPQKVQVKSMSRILFNRGEHAGNRGGWLNYYPSDHKSEIIQQSIIHEECKSMAMAVPELCHCRPE